MQPRKILVFNPGSTSDKIALFDNDRPISNETVRYEPADLSANAKLGVTSQIPLRTRAVRSFLRAAGTALDEVDAFIGRGGLIAPVPSGVYLVDARLRQDLLDGRGGEHPSNLGGIIMADLAAEVGKEAWIADPVVVDELCVLARYTGVDDIRRSSVFHALNQKRVARRVCAERGKRYEESTLIVVHAGGGISVGVHDHGQVVDVNNALTGEGPFTPERSGALPIGEVLRRVEEGTVSWQRVRRWLRGKGGLISYTGTSNVELLERFASGGEVTVDEGKQLRAGLSREATREVLEAMVYQIAKEVGALATTVRGAVDIIVITGGLAHAKEAVVRPLEERVSWIAPVVVVPGEDEMAALRDAALAVLRGRRELRRYEI